MPLASLHCVTLLVDTLRLLFPCHFVTRRSVACRCLVPRKGPPAAELDSPNKPARSGVTIAHPPLVLTREMQSMLPSRTRTEIEG